MLFDLKFTMNGYEVKLTGDTLALEEMASAVGMIAAALRTLPQASQQLQQQQLATDTRIMAISHITRSHDGEKETVKVHGEPWMKYGVSCYPDSCKEGWELVPPALGKKEMSGFVAIVAMKGDNPSRVIGIRKAEFPF